MSDSLLNSTLNSPSYQIFQEQSTMSPFLYSAPESLIGASKNKYSLSFPSTADMNKQVRFDLLRVGLVYCIIAKIRIKVVNASGSTVTGAMGGAVNLIKSADLTTHNRKILTITKDSINNWINKLPQAQRDVIINSVQFDGILPNKYDDDSSSTTFGQTVDATTLTTGNTHYITTYVYLPFPCFHHLATCLDTTFLEDMAVQIQIGADSDLLEAATGTATVTIDTTNSQLDVYYINVSNDNYKAYQRGQFSLEAGRNLNILLQDVYEEKSKQTGTLDHDTTTASEEIDLPINCRNLIKEIVIRATPDTSGYGLEGVEVMDIAIHLNGKEYIKWTSQELLLLNCISKSTAVNLGATNQVGSHWNAANSNAGMDNIIYTLPFTLNDSMAFSGALSARNCGNPFVRVRVREVTDGDSNQTYTVRMHCEFYSIISISQTDGRILKSQNI